MHVRKAWHKRPTVGVDDVGASRHQNRPSWAHYLDHGAANHHHGIWNWFTSVPIYQDGMCDCRNLLSTRWRSDYQNDKGRNPNGRAQHEDLSDTGGVVRKPVGHPRRFETA